MDSLENAYRLKRAGRFPDALLALGEAWLPPTARIAAEVLRAELLEGVGQHRQAMALATSLLRSRQLRPADHGACEYILGEILLEDGDVVGGMDHLQRSASRAQDASVRASLAARLKLMAGCRSVQALVQPRRFRRSAPTRNNLGDPRHCEATFVRRRNGGEARAVENARRHSAIARHILSSAPNIYLEAFCNNLDLPLAFCSAN
jgi:hypothetical protein